MTITPLTQTKFSRMACPHSYIYQESGHEMPDSLISDRGSEFHDVMAPYIRACAAQQVKADWGLFDSLSEKANRESGSILDGIRDEYVVDWENLLDTEITLMLDEDFRPAYRYMENGEIRTIAKLDNVEYSENEAAYKGTLDVALVKSVHAKIEDFKTSWKPFDVDEGNKIQGRMYSVLLLPHFPEIERVVFELIFARYKKVRRKNEFKREHLPQLMKELERARRRQIFYHEQKESGEALQVLPGDHCSYCPLVTNWGCPIAEYVPHANLPAEEHAKFVIYYDKARERAMEAVKAYVAANESLTIMDANGNEYTAGFHSKESQVYPAAPVLAKLMDWNDRTGGMEKALISGLEIKSTTLKSKLEAKKRKALLDEMLGEGIIERKEKVAFGIKSKSSGDITGGYENSEY